MEKEWTSHYADKLAGRTISYKSVSTVGDWQKEHLHNKTERFCNHPVTMTRSEISVYFKMSFIFITVLYICTRNFFSVL